MLVRDFYKVLTGEEKLGMTLECSVESHLITLASEKSRRSGEVCYVHKKK